MKALLEWWAYVRLTVLMVVAVLLFPVGLWSYIRKPGKGPYGALSSGRS